MGGVFSGAKLTEPWACWAAKPAAIVTKVDMNFFIVILPYCDNNIFSERISYSLIRDVAMRENSNRQRSNQRGRIDESRSNNRFWTSFIQLHLLLVSADIYAKKVHREFVSVILGLSRKIRFMTEVIAAKFYCAEQLI
jgi:flagellar biosynthesis regulator FlaF